MEEENKFMLMPQRRVRDNFRGGLVDSRVAARGGKAGGKAVEAAGRGSGYRAESHPTEWEFTGLESGVCWWTCFCGQPYKHVYTRRAENRSAENIYTTRSLFSSGQPSALCDVPRQAARRHSAVFYGGSGVAVLGDACGGAGSPRDSSYRESVSLPLQRRILLRSTNQICTPVIHPTLVIACGNRVIPPGDILLRTEISESVKYRVTALRSVA